MGEPIRLCMIGAGKHSSANMYPYFHKVNGAEFVANCDLDLDKARAVARSFGIPNSYSDYREMVRAEKPDGVLVCVGPGFHPKAAVDLLGMGCHVYTEKPTAETLDQCRQVLDAQQKAGKICMTAYKKRFAPAYRKAKAYIDSEEFGRPSLLTVIRTKGHNPDRDTGDSGYLLDWGCHVLDLVPYLFGHVTRVSVFMTPGRTDSYAINFRFANDAVGQLAVSDRPGMCWEETIAIGSNHRAVRTYNSIEMVAFASDQHAEVHHPQFTHGGTHGGVEQGFVGELQEFVDAIREDRKPESSITEAAHTMAIYEGVQRSVDTDGALVDVEEV